MKAHMQVGDRVLVEPVGVNATIKRLIPVWKLASLNLSRFTSIAVLGGHSMKRNCCHYCARENEDNTRRRAQANQTSAAA